MASSVFSWGLLLLFVLVLSFSTVWYFLFVVLELFVAFHIDYLEIRSSLVSCSSVCFIFYRVQSLYVLHETSIASSILFFDPLEAVGS